MVGVSTTLIGLVKVAKGHMGPSRVDEYAGLAALLFPARADPTCPFAMANVPTSAGDVSGLQTNLHLRARCHLDYCCVVLPTSSSNGPIMTAITASMDRFELSAPPREARGSGYGPSW